MRHFVMLVVLCAMCVSSFLTAIFVWPTPYRYDKMRIGTQREYPLRVNRFSGQAWMLKSSGWEPIGDGRESDLIQLSQSEISKLCGNASYSFGRFSASIYNGSRFRIRELDFRISAWNSLDSPPIICRHYRATPIGTAFVDPGQQGRFSFETETWEKEPIKWEWVIASAGVAKSPYGISEVDEFDARLRLNESGEKYIPLSEFDHLQHMSSSD